MKKVLFVATVTSHINLFHIPYLKWFKKQGYEVHVASNGEEKIEYCDKHYNLPFERFPLKKNNLKTYKELKKIISQNHYDIIHCHTPVGGVLTRLASRKERKDGSRVIYTVHGFHFYKGAPLINWIIYYPIEKIFAKYTDCLITITNEDYEFAKRKLNIKNIQHINGIGFNTDRLKNNLTIEEKQKQRKKLKINLDDIVLTYVAELNANKNQILLINVVEKIKKTIPNVKLLLVGNGVLIEEYKQLIINKQLENNVKILGKRNDINEILSITNIYVASSIREGLPVNIMEAMYKGLPIVATNNRGHRELIRNNETGYIINNYKNSNLMTNKIIDLIKDKKKANEFGCKNKELSQIYCIENVLKEMEKIYINE